MFLKIVKSKFFYYTALPCMAVGLWFLTRKKKEKDTEFNQLSPEDKRAYGVAMQLSSAFSVGLFGLAEDEARIIELINSNDDLFDRIAYFFNEIKKKDLKVYLQKYLKPSELNQINILQNG